MNLDFRIQKTNAGIRISFQKIPYVPIFRQNAQLWLFRSKFDLKRNLESKIQKTNVRIRISILEIPCVPIFRQNAQLWLFWPRFSQKWILGLEFQKFNVGINVSILEIPWLLSPNFPKNRFWSPNFKSQSLGLESAPPIYL